MARHGTNARRPRVLGMLAVLVGGLAVLISFVALDWYTADGGVDSVGSITFARLSAASDRPGLAAIAPAYFHWLAWLVLIVLVGVGMAATVPTPAASALRAAGLVLGVGGAVATYFALDEIRSFGTEGTYAFHHATVGIWFALGGFLLAGLGAVAGPQRI